MKTFVLAVLSCALSVVFDVSPIHAASNDPQVIRQKVNIAGRQRMLSQRMSAAACIAMTGLDAGARAQVAQVAHDEFDKALNGLRDGDPDLGLPVEARPVVRGALDEVAATWDTISPAVLQLASGYANITALSQIMEDNGELLRLSNEAVQAIVSEYGGSAIAADLANAIDVAGRQRMLSQRMVKAACFLFVDVGGDAMREELISVISLFERSLNDLINGNAAQRIAAPPRPAVTRQLVVVADLWQPFRQQLEDMASGKRAGPADLLAIAAAGDAVLTEANKAVQLYVQ